MLKNLKNRKKKGFTLVELVVVIAIIAILAAVLIPQLTGYIKDARKTDVIAQAKEVVTAVNSVNAKQGSDTIKPCQSVSEVLTMPAVSNLIDTASIDKLGSATIEQLEQILETDKFDFVLNDDDTLGDITQIATP